jgi:hypothetical protein
MSRVGGWVLILFAVPVLTLQVINLVTGQHERMGRSTTIQGSLGETLVLFVGALVFIGLGVWVIRNDES